MSAPRLTERERWLMEWAFSYGCRHEIEALHAQLLSTDPEGYTVAEILARNAPPADAPRLLTDDQRQALAAALAIPSGTAGRYGRIADAIAETVAGKDAEFVLTHEHVAAWLLAMDARGRGC